MVPGGDNDWDATPMQCHSCRTAHRAVDDWTVDDLAGVYVATDHHPV